MATLINGNGNPAVYANQDADLIASICGDKTCISAVGSQFAATQEDANTIGLADGVIITKEGRRIQLDVGYTDLFTIPTGTAGTTSYYIIGYKLTTGSDSKQTCETFVQKMNSSSETITEDTFRGGASDVYVSVYRVVQDGLNIDSITGLLPTLSLGAQTSSSHSGSGSTVTTTLAANKTLDEVTQQMLDNDYALKSDLTDYKGLGYVANTDINTIFKSCNFLALANCQNLPTNNSWYTVSVDAGGTGSYTQTAVSSLTGQMYYRHYDGNTWSNWYSTIKYTQIQVSVNNPLSGQSPFTFYGIGSIAEGYTILSATAVIPSEAWNIVCTIHPSSPHSLYVRANGSGNINVKVMYV